MPASAMDNPFAQQQKILLYLFPLIFAVSGVNFPLGVLLYWLTTNVWSMGQQFYVIRRNPAPGSVAHEARQARLAAKAAARKPELSSGSAGTGTGTVGAPDTPGAPPGPNGSGAQPGADGAARPGGQRQQPKRQPRKKR
jgi:YidC/Oxa1 family membrane protein insertase